MSTGLCDGWQILHVYHNTATEFVSAVHDVEFRVWNFRLEFPRISVAAIPMRCHFSATLGCFGVSAEPTFALLVVRRQHDWFLAMQQYRFPVVSADFIIGSATDFK